MSIPKPHFELARVYDDGTRETEIVSVVGLPWDTKMDRRGFLGAGATAGAVLGAMYAQDSAWAAENQPRGRDAQASKRSVLGDCDGYLAHLDHVTALTISPDGKLLASGGGDKTIKLWDLPEGLLRKTLEGHGLSVDALAISPDGTLLASGGYDKTINLWGLPEGALRKTLKGNRGPVNALAISPDGRLLVSGGLYIMLWSLPEGALRNGHTIRQVNALAISPDGKLLASGGDDHAIELRSLRDVWLREKLQGHRHRIKALAISRNGKLLASGGLDNTIKLWDLPEGALRKTLEGHRDEVKALAISPDGKLLASGSNDNTIKLWGLPEGALRKTLEGHRHWVRALAISPDGKLLASGSGDETIKLWSLPNGEIKNCLVDLKATYSSSKGVTYQHKNENGQVVTYTGPCGSAIPSGAVCTCNCVAGSRSPPALPPIAPRGGGGNYTYCTCNKVCTCIPVRCQAHRVLHEEPLVRTMAEELLLLMGAQEFEYMAWAADKAEPALQTRIHEILQAIEAGALPDPGRWPTTDECIARLDDPDDVVALMAAQMLAQKMTRQGLRLDDELRRRGNQLIREANQRSPFSRTCRECTCA